MNDFIQTSNLTDSGNFFIAREKIEQLEKENVELKKIIDEQLTKRKTAGKMLKLSGKIVERYKKENDELKQQLSEIKTLNRDKGEAEYRDRKEKLIGTKATQELTLLAEGELKHDITQTAEDEFRLDGIFIADTYRNKNIWLNDLLPYDYAVKSNGKHIKIFFIEEEEE